MTLHAGFAEIDITPPLGTAKIGWLRMLRIERIHDPLFARAAVFATGGQQLGFIQLDTLSVRWTTCQQIRQEISRRCGFPGQNVMISATHNHGGPAIANIGDVPRDEAYLATLVERCATAFARALEQSRPATLLVAYQSVFGFSFNRRVIMRTGLSRTHGRFSDPLALCSEGPIDPELCVLGARDENGKILGCLINFACHPTHLGGDDQCTAGWPGVLARALKGAGCPVPMLLNGAAAEIHTTDITTGVEVSMEDMGIGLAKHVQDLLQTATPLAEAPLAASSQTLELPYRRPSPEEIAGTLRGAQRFIDPAIYDRHMPALLARIAQRKVQPAQVQALHLGPCSFVAIPAEYFCSLGLRIKEKTHPRHTLIVGYANGMIGYVPTNQAFERGGYETTFIASSRMAPETGDLLAQCAIEQIQRQAVPARA